MDEQLVEHRAVVVVEDAVHRQTRSGLDTVDLDRNPTVVKDRRARVRRYQSAHDQASRFVATEYRKASIIWLLDAVGMPSISRVG